MSTRPGPTARQCYEDAKVADHSAPAPVNDAPTGVTVFANDFRTIRVFADRENRNIVYWSEHNERGFLGDAVHGPASVVALVEFPA